MQNGTFQRKKHQPIFSYNLGAWKLFPLTNQNYLFKNTDFQFTVWFLKWFSDKKNKQIFVIP